MLAFVLELRWHLMYIVPRDVRMTLDKLSEDGCARSVQSDDENVLHEVLKGVSRVSATVSVTPTSQESG